MSENKLFIPHNNTGPQHQADDDTATPQPTAHTYPQLPISTTQFANTHHNLTCLSVPSINTTLLYLTN
jgi:hypothetical protein